MMKFIASNAEAATAKAKRALGDKTVIVAMRNLPSGDVEVTASDTPAPSAPAPYNETPGFATNAREAIDNDLTRGGGARLNEAMEQRYAEDALEKLKGKSGEPGRKSSAASRSFQRQGKSARRSSGPSWPWPGVAG